MPNAAPAAGTGTPVSGDHTNATEISAPVVEEGSIHDPIEDPDTIGSHREETAEAEVEETDPQGEEEDVVPPVRLKGKSLAQVYKEFAGLEKEYSRQGNELGEARGLLRQALEINLKQPGAKTPEDLSDPTDEEFDADPKAAAKKLVAKELKPLKDAVLSAEQRATMLEFDKRHPGYIDEANTPQFQEWVKATSYRTRMFTAAANFDVEAAEDLFTMWSEHKAAQGGEGEDPAARKRAAVKRVTTESGGAGKTAGGRSGKPTYKSSELARLYIQDRDRYNEILENDPMMFAEKRVR